MTDNNQRDRVVAQYAYLISPIARSFPFLRPGISVEDLEQTGLVALLDLAQSYDPQRADTFAAYARMRIRGACLDLLGQENRETPLTEDAPAKLVSIDTALARRECQEFVTGAVGQLTARQREVISFRFTCGYTQTETGRRLGISQEAVRRLEDRALNRMKRQLRPAA